MEQNFVIVHSLEKLSVEIDNVKEQFKNLMIEQKDYYDFIQCLTLVRLHIDSIR